MARAPRLQALPERERRETIGAFLAVIGQHPNLAHLRTVVRTGPERQLALFAAWERAVIVGGPDACPPSHDDPADSLLCDILEVIDHDPQLKLHGAYYGADRHLANLQ